MNLPILMYHTLLTQPGRCSDLAVSVQEFQKQIDFLKSQGYQTVSLDRLSRACRGKGDLPPKPVVVTFDDAYACVLETAKPILDRAGFTATVFAVSQAVGRHNFWDDGKKLPAVPCLDGRALQALAAAGWEIGSHGATHVNLAGLAKTDLKREIEGSRQELERILGRPVSVFAYPFGAWDGPAHKVVKQSGYRAACSISPGTPEVTVDLYALRRVYVKGKDSLRGFRRKISPWYLKFRAWRKR